MRVVGSPAAPDPYRVHGGFQAKHPKHRANPAIRPDVLFDDEGPRHASQVILAHSPGGDDT